MKKSHKTNEKTPSKSKGKVKNTLKDDLYWALSRPTPCRVRGDRPEFIDPMYLV